MKKLLCFLTGVLFVISGLYAQENCIGFLSPNLYPGASTQTIMLSFDNVEWSSANQYTLHYEFYKKSDSEEDFHLMTELEMENDFQNSAWLALFFGSNYYGQYLTINSSGYFPNGRFEAGSNMRDYSYNYFNKDYLQIGKLRLDLGWRSDRDYTGLSYKLIIKLITMQDDGNDITMWKYNNKIIGGNNASYGGVTVAIDTITTIKHLTEAINDTVCYREAFNGYKHGRTILVADTINKPGYKQDMGSSFYSIFPQTVEFGDACNGRIDSIGTVNFFVRNQLSFDTVRTGSILQICNETCTAGLVYVKFSNGVAPYTIQVDKDGAPYRTLTYETDATNFLIDSLQVGTYTLALTDNAGCDTVITGVKIVVMDVPNDLSVTLTPSPITCHNGSDGSITSNVTAATGEVVLPITYKWNSTDGTNVSDSTREAITKLSAGTYTVVATDKYGCAATNSVELQNPATITSKDTIYCCANELADGVHYKPEADTIFYAAGEKEVHFTSVQGCDSTVTVTLISFENPTMVFSSNGKVCQNDKIEISLSEGDMRDGFYWTYDGGTLAPNTDADQSIEVSWATAGNKTVSANYTQYYTKPSGGIHGCRAVSDTTVTITVNPLPDATVTTKVNDNDSTLDIKACAGDIIILNAAQNEDYAYVWQLNGQDIENATEASLTITASENGNYTVILTDTSSAKGTNCQNESETIKITVYSPNVEFEPMEDWTICADGEAGLTVELKDGFEGTPSYQWYIFDEENDQYNEIEGATNNSYNAGNIEDTTTYMVKITATVETVCSVEKYDTVVVNVNNPSVTLTPMTDQTQCGVQFSDGVEITLTTTVENSLGTLDYVWSDNTPRTYDISVATLETTIIDTTEFYVAVTATIGNCTATAKDTVVVNVNNPDVTFNPLDDQTLCAAEGTPTAELIIEATAANGSALTYAWTSNKGLTITNADAATATAQPTDTTEFYLVVTADLSFDETTCQVTKKDTMVVNVNTPSVTLGQMEDQTVCYEEEGETGAELTAIVSNSRGTLSYDWSSNMNASFAEMEEGLVWADLQDTTTIYLAVTAALDINADMTCRFTAYDTVVVNVNHPGVTLTEMTDQTICKEATTTANLSITATPQNGSALTYAWTNDKDATFSDATIFNPVATLTDTTEFTVVVTATIGECSVEEEGTVTVNVNAPNVAFEAMDDVTICASNETELEVTLTDDFAGTPSYKWYIYDEENQEFTEIADATDDSYLVENRTDTTTYRVKITATIGDCPAFAYDTVTVNVNNPKVSEENITITTTGNPICQGSSTHLTASVEGTYGTISYAWNDNVQVADTTVTPEATATYTVAVTATIGECFVTATKDIEVVVNDTVKLAATGDTTFAICVGSEYIGSLLFEAENATLSVTGLPTGMEYSDNGLYGTPNAVGTFHYTVTATSTKDPACDSKIITGTITVNDTVRYTVTNELNQILCWENMGDTVTVTVENATINPTVNGLGTLAGTNSLKIFRDENTAVGNHTFSLSIESTTGCNLTNKTVEGSIKVNDTIRFTISGDTTFTVCVGSAIDPVMISVENAATGMGIDGIMIEDLPDGLTFTSDEGIHGNPEEFGTFHYTVESRNRFMSNGRGCPGRTFTGTITVNDTVKLTVTGDTTQTKCLGEALTNIGFAVENGNGALTWENNAPAGVTQSETGISGTPTEYGTFRYTYNATSTANCPNSDKAITGTLTINDTIKLEATNANQEICLGDAIDPIVITNANSEVTVSFNNDDNNGLTYQDGAISGTPTAARNISYTITATSTNNCGDPKQISGTIVVNDTIVTLTATAPASTEIELEATYLVCANASETNDTITFTTAADMTNYTWNVNGGTIVSGENTNVIKVQWEAYGDKNVTVAYTNPNTTCRGTSNPATIHVVEAPTFTVAGSEADNRICAYTDATDTLKITATNSLEAIHYEWTPDNLTEISNSDNKVFEGNNLTFGEHAYTIVATTPLADAIYCQVTNSITITVDTLPSVTLTKTDPLCYNAEDGSAIATTADAVNNYSFIWNNEVNTSYNTGISATEGNETYTVTVTDNRTGCTVTKDITLVNPAEIELTKSEHINVDCYGNATGSFKVSAIGGTPFTGNTYQYILNNDGSDSRAIDSTFRNLVKGYYTVTVLDKNGCSAEIKDTIKEPDAALSVVIDSVNINCFDGNNGEITLTVAGGTPDYNYEWEGPTGSNIDNANNPAHALGLIAGRYTIHVTDANNCPLDTAVTLTQPDKLIITSFATDSVKCNEGEDGKITVNVTGGTEPYQYSIDGDVFQDENYFTGLEAGEYTIIVRDAKECEASKDTTIYEPAALSITFTTDSVKCSGGNDGKITVNVTGGTQPYQYSKDGTNYQESNIFDDLTADTYTIYVKDAKNCTDSKDTTIYEPAALSITFASDSVSCNEGNDGKITVNVIGGTGAYLYSKNGTDYQSENVFDGLLAGEYTIYVKDENNCPISKDTLVYEPAALTAVASISREYVQCYGYNDGEVTVTVEGGNGGFTYKLKSSDNDYGTSNTFTDLYARIDTVLVKDRKGCETKAGFEIKQHEQLTLEVSSKENISCNGGYDGSITVVAGGGAGNYQYKLNDEPATMPFEELTAGEYDITVVDDSNCTYSLEEPVVLTEPNALTVVIDSTNIKCYDGDNGKIALTVNGGTGDYNYAWAGPNGYTGSGATIETLKAGRYTVHITDEHNCPLDTVVTLTQPEELTITVESYSNITCFGLTNGSITVSSDGGTGDHIYSLNGGTFTGTHQWLYQLGENDYTITVKDDNGCTKSTDPIHIAEPTKLIVKHTSTDLSCYNDNTGAITLTVEGGTPNVEEPYYTYLWNDASTDKDREDLAAGTYTVIVQDMNQCKGYDTVKLVQPDQFSIEINEEENEVCAGDSKTFTTALLVNNEEVPTTEGYTFQWYKAVDNEEYVAITDSTDTHITVSEAATYKIVAIQTASSCEQYAEINLDVYELPTVTITAVDTVCAAGYDDENEINIEASGNADSYAWAGVLNVTIDENFVVDDEDPSTALLEGNVAGTYVFSVTGRVAHDYVTCSKTVTDTIVVLPLPAVAISGKSEVCAGNDDTLTATGAITYVWDDDDNITAIEGIDDKVVFNATASIGDGYTIYVTGTDAFGCQNIAEITINVNPLPVADIWVGDQADGDHYAYQGDTHDFCYGTEIFLTNVYNYDDEDPYDYSYKWFFINGQGEIEEIPDENGSEYVTTVEQTVRYVLQVTDNETGCVNKDTVTIIMNTLPEVTVSEDFQASRICADSIFHITMTTNATEIEFIDWYIDDEQIENSGNSLTTILDGYTRGEEHEISVIVYDGNSCAGESNALKLIVDTLPTAVLSEDFGASRICADSNFHFTIAAAATAIQWMNGTEEIDNADATTYTTNESGLYYVTVTDGHGCSSNSSELEVVVDTVPNVTVTRDEVVVCMQSAMDLTATGAEDYSWTSIDDIEANTLHDNVFSTGTADVPGTAGTYRIEVTGTDGNSCSAKDTITIEVRDLQTTADISLPEEVTLCENGTVGFKVKAEYSNYEWDSNLDNSLTHYADQPDTVTFTATTNGDNGDFNVYVVVTDENGCQASATTTVHVNNLPDVTITRVNTPLCQGDTITFKTEAGMTDYAWTYTEENVAYFSVEDSILKVIWSEDVENTIVNVTVNYSDANGCRAEVPAETEEEINVLPNIVINDGDNLDTICRGTTEIVTVAGGVSYVWNNVVEWENATADDALYITPVNDTLISVIGTDAHGCKNYDTLHIYVNDTVIFTLTNNTQEICLGQSIENIVLSYENCTLNLNELDIPGIRVEDDIIMGAPTSANMEEGYIFEIVATSTANPACESKTETITIVVNDTVKLAMNAEFGDTTQTICLGQSIEEIAFESNVDLYWDNDNNDFGITFEEISIAGTPTQPGVFHYTVYASEDLYCNPKAITGTITVKDTNKLAIISENEEQEICLGQSIGDIMLDTSNCTLTFEPALITMNLEFDPATATISGTPETATTQTFTITATPTNANCYDAKTVEFTVTVNDTVSLTATGNLDQKICLGEAIENVKFTVANGELSIMEGTTFDGIQLNDTDSTLTGTPTAATTGHIIKVQATNTACPLTNKTIEVKVVVDTIPAVEITADDATICPNGQQSATLTATAGYATYTWSTDNTEVTYNTVTVTPEEETTYTVTVKNGEGCTASNTIDITLHTLPAITISGDNEICLGQSTDLTVEIDDDHTVLSYEWVGITSESADINLISVTPVADSTFRVRVVDVDGCFDTAKIEITVDTLPVPNLTADMTSVCQNGTITFTANSAYNNYQWGDNGVLSESTVGTYELVTTTSTESGEHAITVKITDGNNCVSNDTVKVTVNKVPMLEETHNRVSCNGESTAFIDLTVTNTTSNLYNWSEESDASFSSDNEDLRALSAGTYNVTVTSQDGGLCSATLSVTIDQPDVLKAIISAPGNQLCSGQMTLTATPEGGNNGYTYVWMSDGVNGSSTSENTLTIEGSTLSAGIHNYSVRVMDDSNCVTTAVIAAGSIDTIWTITSERIEVHHEINLGPDETYTYDGVTYDTEGQVFEVNVGAGTGGCDSVIINTIHVFGIGMHFAEDPLDVTHSTYRQEYAYRPNRIGDTITTSVGVDNLFYTYVTTAETTWDAARVDMKYEILFNDSPIENEDFEDIVDNFKISAYYEKDNRFYGYELDSARGEEPATTFYYQIPSNSTAYFFDYFNFKAFNNMPQKIDFRFSQAGTYIIKFFVEERIGGSAGSYWGLYNPFVLHRQQGPIWGGRGDNPTGKNTIAARYMTILVGEGTTSDGNPVISTIDDYSQANEPTVTTYPNPARDMLYLNINGMDGLTHITITDAAGKVVAVYDENLLNSENTLNYSVAKFAQGIYFLNVYNNDTVITQKFIISK